MFKVKGQRSRSQRKVMYQQQKRYDNGYIQRLQTWHGVVIKEEKDWRGVGRPQVAMHSPFPRFLVLVISTNLHRFQVIADSTGSTCL